MNTQLRDALAERLTDLYDASRKAHGEESWDFSVYAEEVASRLLETVPGEEEMAKMLTQTLYGTDNHLWASEQLEEAQGGHGSDMFTLARFILSHCWGWKP